eukprot:7961308-Alexandrium_andersonii.AAC.1
MSAAAQAGAEAATSHHPSGPAMPAASEDTVAGHAEAQEELVTPEPAVAQAVAGVASTCHPSEP